MRPFASLVVALAIGLGLSAGGSASSSARPSFGFTEDATKYANDGGASLLDQFDNLGVSENRVVVFWDPDRPDVIDEKAFLDRFLPQAQRRGIKVVFSVQSRKANGYTRSPQSADQFVAFMVKIAKTYPQVTELIVGNEPNQPRFWQPQFGIDGTVASAKAYTELLAKAYDALKGVNPNITVVGVGLSPRGNDRANAQSNASVSPVRFIKEMGDAYKAMKRSTPLMDVLAIHIYPNVNTDAPSKGYPWPGIGFPNFDRLKQAVWDAFHDTAQPVFPEDAAALSATSIPTLRLKIDEIGWQTVVPTGKEGVYSGSENVPPITEAQQADYYRQAALFAICEPEVEAALFFHIVDESDLARFQSGVLAPDGSPKGSWGSIPGTVQQSCPKSDSWRHRADVDGAQGIFDLRKAGKKRRSWSVIFKANEAYKFKAAILRLPDGAVVPPGLEDQVRGLLGFGVVKRGGKQVAMVMQAAGDGVQNRGTQAKFAKRRLAPGRYVYAGVLNAAMNPDRVTLLVSKPFRVV